MLAGLAVFSVGVAFECLAVVGFHAAWPDLWKRYGLPLFPNLKRASYVAYWVVAGLGLMVLGGIMMLSR